MQANLVGLGRVPGKIESTRSFAARPDAVFPAESGDEIATGVANGGDPKFFDEIDDIRSEALTVGARMPWLVNSVIDAASEVLDKGAE